MLFKVAPVTKKLKNILNELGSDYSIKVIDGENVIYRKINTQYDIEISGLNNQKESFSCSIYVWDISKGEGATAHSVEKIFGIDSLKSLKDSLKNLMEKYQSLLQQ